MTPPLFAKYGLHSLSCSPCTSFGPWCRLSNSNVSPRVSPCATLTAHSRGFRNPHISHTSAQAELSYVQLAQAHTDIAEGTNRFGTRVRPTGAKLLYSGTPGPVLDHGGNGGRHGTSLKGTSGSLNLASPDHAQMAHPVAQRRAYRLDDSSESLQDLGTLSHVRKSVQLSRSVNIESRTLTYGMWRHL